MKQLISSAIFIASMLAGSAFASEPINAAVTDYKYTNGTLFISLIDNPSGKPACATSEAWDYRVDVSGKNIALLRVLMANRGAEHAFKGTGDCTGNVENLQFIGSPIES